MEVSATGTAQVQAQLQMRVLRTALDAAREQAAALAPADPSGLAGAVAAREALKGLHIDAYA